MKISLSTRLTFFFLGTLAIVLMGFSVTLYALASKYLHRQADERLEAALNTLAAAAEIGPEGVEWEPQERTLSFGRRTIEGQFSWRVGDGSGERLDGSSAGELDRILASHVGGLESDGRRRFNARVSGIPWRMMTRQLDGPHAITGRIAADRSTGRHNSLVFGAALSLDGVRATILNLASALGGLSLSIWILALLSVRRLCRTALRPVTMMAEAAQAIGSHHDLDERLPTSETGDELEELGRSFNDLLDRLHESFERQRQFTGNASHQLRTPLTAIQGQVDLALRQDRSAEEYRLALSLVQRKTRHVRQIVESLLFLARADAEAQRPQLQRIELAAWVREHLESRSGPRTSDIRLEVGATGPFWVRSQPSLLGDLLENLLENAAKYSETGTPIVVSLEREGDRAALIVQDSGMGIADEEIAKIFEPFYRSPEARRRGCSGVGLGLSVASRLASLFDGRLEVMSQPNRGSRFTFSTPIAEQPVSPSIVSPASSHDEPVAKPNSPALAGLWPES